MPTEGPYVIGVSALGPTERKSYYSNYGVEQTDVSAPGGDRREYYGTAQYNAPENRQLSTVPEFVVREQGWVDEEGNPNTPFVERSCHEGVCGYYWWIQGTSMASPHAVGVAALIVSEFGVPDPAHPGGLTMRPSAVQNRLEGTATRSRVSEPAAVPLPGPGSAAGVRRVLRGIAAVQRLLRPRHRGRAGRGELKHSHFSRRSRARGGGRPMSGRPPLAFGYDAPMREGGGVVVIGGRAGGPRHQPRADAERASSTSSWSAAASPRRGGTAGTASAW